MLVSTSLGLEGKRVFVSGAASGIGSATVKLLASLGAKLTITDIQPLDELVALLRSHDVEVNAFQADLSKPLVVEEPALADLYAVVALPGVFLTGDWMADDEWEATFRHVIDINNLAVLRLMRVCLPILERNGTGRVVLVGSLAGRMGGDPAIVQPHYAISRGGGHTLTYNLARRYGPKGIAVNGVAPGTIGTAANVGNFDQSHKFAAGRMGTAMEVAWPIAFLCSPHASYMSGSILDVNGGSYMI